MLFFFNEFERERKLRVFGIFSSFELPYGKIKARLSLIFFLFNIFRTKMIKKYNIWYYIVFYCRLIDLIFPSSKIYDLSSFVDFLVNFLDTLCFLL